MKLSKHIIIGCLSLLFLSETSCSKWLDVNTDPENPTLESVEYQLLLANMQFYTNGATQIGAWRSAMGMGDWTRYYDGGLYWKMSFWYPDLETVVAPYQWFFVGAGPNIKEMYNKAMEAGQYHYAAAAKFIYAYGFMAMTDIYGEIPFTEALGESSTPAYDNGKTIFIGCLEAMDEAIDLFQRSVDSSLPSLSEGDSWNNGDLNKWLKLCYLMKARWCNKLSKKAQGSYLEGKYDKSTILDCLDKAMKSNSENTIVNHVDGNSTTHDHIWGEPVDQSPIFSSCGMNAGYMVTKMLYDNLTDFDGLGVEDPRADHIIPWAYSLKTDSSPSAIKWNGNWRRSLGVDMASAINSQGGPLRAAYADGRFYISSDNADRLGDTVYVECTSSSKGYLANEDILYRRGDVYGSEESGSFYTRVSSPTYLGTYSEACFIKAEVLFNSGDVQGAFTAYKQGIEASIDLMNEKLKAWVSEDSDLSSCPSFTPISDTDKENFLENGIGTASSLTLGRIMTQKRLAMMFSLEIWNDMRRYDFDSDIFLGWSVPAYHDVNSDAQTAVPLGRQLRRFRHSYLEYEYNTTSLQAIGYDVDGADMSYVSSNGIACWNVKPDAWTINVWWDSSKD